MSNTRTFRRKLITAYKPKARRGAVRRLLKALKRQPKEESK